MAPGADGTASAMSAAFAIADAITRYNEYSPHDPISLYVFWLPAEHYGHVGSARIIHDAQYFQCDTTEQDRKANNNNINNNIKTDHNSCMSDSNHRCTDGIYKDYLNATTIDFTKFRTVIALDQLSFSPHAPLYVHVDDRVLHTTSA